MKNITGKICNILLTKNKPVSLVHFITNRCNARCPHCFIDFDDSNSQRATMSIEDIDQLTKTMGNALMNVNLTGGEPFLRQDILDIARCYYKNTLIDSIFITTHGGFTKKILDFSQILKKEFPDRKLIFSISIDHFPESHNKYRKIKNLFQNAISTYKELGKMGENIFTNIGITLSPFNYEVALDLYDFLKSEGVKSFTVTLVRDEGVYKTPQGLKKLLLKSYEQLTRKIQEETKKGIISGYSQKNYLGRMMNKKEEIMNKNIKRTYLSNEFISPCRSGALFGVLHANGDVYPCEVLSKKMGNVYDFNLNFLNLWNSKNSKDLKKWVVDSKCRCTYECAWSYNILGNKEYLPEMACSFLFPK